VGTFNLNLVLVMILVKPCVGTVLWNIPMKNIEGTGGRGRIRKHLLDGFKENRIYCEEYKWIKY
jgi:hypothetical protein